MKIQFVVSAVALLTLASCQIETKREEPTIKASANKPLVDPKYSLTQDRSEFDRLRESVPEEKKQANDEKALFAEWTVELKKSPADVREKFDNLVRKKRDLFNKDMTKTREQFTKSLEKKRADFLKDLESKRKDFANQKKSRDEKNDFFNELDGQRRDYFSEEKEKREEFEANVRDQRKNFEDYMAEKRAGFNSEMKSYTEKYNLKQAELKKQ
ncbi:MAG: hypothetical protein H7235_01890 [Bdellovibrionaceae bacterium]|nr:hypothetical protein [Pseudobdellovibrionaceae bacterium]MBC7457001.1 hypothetical protein [Pseudobdellovibrionaceae bacterium]